MTETAAQIATLPPELFLNGKRGSGQVLPHAEIQICGAASAPSPQVGTIVIQAKSLMLGYFPDATYPDSFPTDDLGYFDAQGILHIVGQK